MRPHDSYAHLLDAVAHLDTLAEPEAEPIPYERAGTAAALEAAGWHLRHIATIRRDVTILDDVYRAEFDRLTARYKEQRARLTAREQWHTAPLLDLHRRIRDDDPRRKTINLPHGTLKSTAQAPSVEVEPDVLLKWAEVHRPELIRQTPSVKRDALRRLLAAQLAVAAATGPGWPEAPAADPETGETMPGVVIRPATVTYSVQTGTGGD